MILDLGNGRTSDKDEEFFGGDMSKGISVGFVIEILLDDYIAIISYRAILKWQCMRTSSRNMRHPVTKKESGIFGK
jgi:hypothetical protein